jgi:hypothetical protein
MLSNNGMQPPTSVRKLYFDIDGTVLALNSGLPKLALAEGRLEAAIRHVRADELICVGNFAGVVRTVWTVQPEYDGFAAIFALCRGVFVDERWFRGLTQLVTDPRLRAGEVDLGADWWYMDDEAEKYFSEAGRAGIFREHLGGRILAPSPTGNGEDVLRWLDSLAQKVAF